MNEAVTPLSLSLFLDEASRRGGVDFHLHSCFSDGAQTAEELVRSVLENGLQAFSLTDHDNIDGVPYVRKALSRLNAKSDIRFIPGVEMSARFEGREVHILGYFTEDQPLILKRYLARQVRERQQRNEAMIKRLNELGYDVRYEDLSRYGGEKTLPGRVHMALWLVEHGAFSSITEAFQKLLGEGRPAFVYRERHSAKEVIRVITASNGVSVLAHPQEYGWCDHERLSKEDVEQTLMARFLTLKKAGIHGLECDHGGASPQERLLMRKLCEKLSLICTAGSDSHGRDDQHAPMYRGSWYKNGPS